MAATWAAALVTRAAERAAVARAVVARAAVVRAVRRVMVAVVAAAADGDGVGGGVGGGDGAGDGGDGCGAVAAWVTGGGIDGGGGETLAACAAAACRSGGPTLVASILCEPERMRSGRCQHVCMRCRRVRAVARTLRRKSPDANSSRPDDAARAPGRRRGCSSERSATLHEAYSGQHRRSCAAFARRVPRALSVLVARSSLNMHIHATSTAEHVVVCSTLAAPDVMRARARRTTSTSARRPRAQVTQNGGDSSGSAAAARTAGAGRSGGARFVQWRRTRTFWTGVGRDLLDSPAVLVNCN